ncbi:hypothetical protein CU097_005765 [Rhizopus azygosporus]|uniref:Tc1-like transposase DDE domain-containing protein n=1 Tax=Rhizopus azygosporus TaxID=86630 RepID=A0A367JC55_RHIAZ|nr:hypothetical protein CU097_005765 [Rhizopus azygosporus]
MTTYIRYDAKRAASTVTGDYLNFIASTLDIMDQQEDFKGYYLIMDNAPIHKHKDIKLYVESCGYGGMHLPPYSPGLSPIEQLWSVCKRNGGGGLGLRLHSDLIHGYIEPCATFDNPVLTVTSVLNV